MMNRRCPYCQELFAPSRYHPDQVVCCREECQRHRRSEYHRQKLNNDPEYRAQCHDSQKQWRELHPDYMSSYRKTHRRRYVGKRPETAGNGRLQLLLELVKNNMALDLKQCAAEVWLICPDVKNTLASAQVVIFDGILYAPPSHEF